MKKIITLMLVLSLVLSSMVALVACNPDGDANYTIPVFGVDAVPEAVEYIKDGVMAGTVKQSATGMAASVALLISNAMNNKADLMDGTADLNVDDDADKIRVPYEKYSGETGGASNDATVPAVTEAGKTGTDGIAHVFYYSYADTYLSTVRTAMQEDLKAAGVTYKEYDGDAKQDVQMNSFETVMAGNPSVIVMNIVDPTATDSVTKMIEACEDAGIPIIFFNREISSDLVNTYDQCAFIGTSTTEAGYMQGEMIAEYLLKDYDKYDLNGDGYIAYIMLKGQEGNPEAEGRTEFSVSEANKLLKAAGKKGLMYYDGTDAGKDKYYVDKDNAWSSQEGQAFTQTVLSTYSLASDNMFELVIANNDGMATGAISALQEAGFNQAA